MNEVTCNDCGMSVPAYSFSQKPNLFSTTSASLATPLSSEPTCVNTNQSIAPKGQSPASSKTAAKPSGQSDCPDPSPTPPNCNTCFRIV
eukprot:3221573-Rhodomonas_salina.2